MGATGVKSVGRIVEYLSVRSPFCQISELPETADRYPLLERLPIRSMILLLKIGAKSPLLSEGEPPVYKSPITLAARTDNFIILWLQTDYLIVYR